MQQTDGLMHCIENFACLHHLHGTIRSLYVSVYFRAMGDQTCGYSRAQGWGFAVRNCASSSNPAVRNRALSCNPAVRNCATNF